MPPNPDPTATLTRFVVPSVSRGAERPIGSKCRPTCRQPAASHAHCSVCHTTCTGVTYFDEHRRDGRCIDLTKLGLIEQDGLWASPEGHERREADAARLAASRVRTDPP